MPRDDIRRWEAELGSLKIDDFYDKPFFDHPDIIPEPAQDETWIRSVNEPVHPYRRMLGWILFYGVLLGIMLLILI
jgi:hypothetical protein